MSSLSHTNKIEQPDFEKLKKLPLEEAVLELGSYEALSSFLKHCTGPLITKMLQAEMDTHLGYKKHEVTGYNTGNSRNGSYKKTLLSENGNIEIEVPRDRNGDFEPMIIPKFQSRTNEMEDKIINMYGLGLTTADIQNHIKEIYGADISKDLVSNITDKIIPEIKEWQGRQLDPFYPIIYLDAVHFKVKDNGKVESK